MKLNEIIEVTGAIEKMRTELSRSMQNEKSMLKMLEARGETIGICVDALANCALAFQLLGCMNRVSMITKAIEKIREREKEAFAEYQKILSSDIDIELYKTHGV